MSKTWFGHYIENIKGDDYVLFTDYVELEQKIDGLNKELDRYKNNWEELKGYIKKFPGISYASSEKVDGERLSGKLIPVTKVLNKMKGLEEKNGKN